MKKVELLSPAGNLQSAYSAFKGGADAVYLGGKQFSARASADNFSDDEIKETARITDCKAEIDEYVKEELNKKLTELKENSEKNPEAKITYFVADKKKSGGKYITVKDRIKKIDVYKRTVLLLCGTEIPIDDIYEIETDFCENEITS